MVLIPTPQCITTAGVPAFACPPGTKMHILDLGTLQADEGWSVKSWFSNVNRRELTVQGCFEERTGGLGTTQIQKTSGEI